METNERLTAVKALAEITAGKGYSNIVLKRTFDRNVSLSRSQKAFVTELVNGVLRNLIYLDYCIDRISTLPCVKMKPFILNNLRAAAYQILFMDAARYAVCNEAVEIAKSNGFRQLSGFVNGVLRNLIRKKDDIKLPDMAESPFRYLSVKYSCPEWLGEYFAGLYGMDAAEGILSASGRAVAVTVCVNTLKTDRAGLRLALEAEGVIVKESVVNDNSLYISGTDDMTGLEAFKSGLFHVMDDSSVLAVKAAGAGRGMSLLDACAAPGGKSFLAAYIMENSGSIKARDIHAHKLGLIRASAERLGITAIETGLGDARSFDADLTDKFDIVLLDAPCSGLGLIGKKPEIKYTKRREDITELAALQREMLKTIRAYVKPGGVLLYSTCTLSVEENENNADWFAENFEFEKTGLECFARDNGIPGCSVVNGYIKLLPQHLGTDGFFISKFTKRC